MPATLMPVTGIIQNVTSFSEDCCEQQVTIRSDNGISQFIISPDTYVIGEVRLRPGMPVAAFYDASLPVPLIFPPRYQAVIIGRRNPSENIYVGYFDDTLTAEDNALKINLSRTTEIVTSNGQSYGCRPENKMLVVYYSETTRSIPPQTTPRKIIVLC